MNRPCIACGQLIAKGSRCNDCQPKRPTAHQRGYTSKWRRLSEKQRKLQGWCNRCRSTDNLQLDHIIPISEAPGLALEPLNTQVLCADCNKKRSNRCSDSERTAVYEALGVQKLRRQLHSLSELEKSARWAN